MPIVTSIKPQKKNPSRYNIYLDDEFAFGVDEENLIKFGLHKGQQLTQPEIDKLFGASELYKLYSRALDFLGYRPRSRKEVTDYLRRKISSYKLSLTNSEDQLGMINSIIARLERAGYLGDAEFTCWWIKQRTQSSSPRGLLAIRSELFQKGIDRELVDRVWQELEVDEYELCQKAAQKKSRHYKLLDPMNRKKLFNYLSRRGFDYQVIQDTLGTRLPS